MEIFIVRHGLSEGNEKMIFQGRIDFPLAKEGRKQAEHLGRFFNQKEFVFDRIITSPLKRAKETAELIASQIDNHPDIESEDAFQEFRIGKLEGVKSADVKELFPSYYKRPPTGWLDFAEFDGESWDELQERVDAVMHKYAPEDKLLENGRLLIVTHGGAIRGILRNLLGVDSGFMYIRVENCCHFKINFVKTRGFLRRYVEYFMPLTAALVDGKPYEYGTSAEQRAKSVS